MEEHETHIIHTLLKFGRETDINDLFYNGTIYMNSIQHFRQIEDGELRGDNYEGVVSIKNYPPGKIETPSIGYKGNYISLHLKQTHGQVFGNIYSLYCVSSYGWQSPLDFKIDEKIKRFGTHCLLVKDARKFISLIENKINQSNLKLVHGFVDYYDSKKVNRRIHLFEKPFQFEYQKEFRFYVERESIDPFVFSIGNLTDICEIHTTETVIEGLKLKPKEK
jgi:hypothetical protein